jgi:GT2 family glycosyltransferase
MSRHLDSFSDIEEAVTVSGSAYFIRRSVWDELTNCSLYQNFSPSNGAFLQTPLFYEETFCSYHVRQHGYKVLYNGQAKMIHEWHQSAKEEEGYVQEVLPVARKMFREACAAHNMECD